ncbi:2892_t:CDS:1 [Acaulospora morrowiae]|uniref:2892_t:CDS:1 n=1 Tax=Acaulospora morrowiae TaxID=94023 RepID=A0A9N9ALU6_9GLOM|nr:2892_t:CDS:1 [Acaulospora morrowiae]
MQQQTFSQTFNLSEREHGERSYPTQHENPLDDNLDRDEKYPSKSKDRSKGKSKKKSHKRYHPFHRSHKSKKHHHDQESYENSKHSSEEFEKCTSDKVDEDHVSSSYVHAEERSWLEHLFDVMAEDDEDFSSMSYAEDSSYVATGIDDMSEEDYANYIRRGMYEKQHEQELREQRKREEKLRKRDEEKRKMMDKLKAEEEMRLKREQEKKARLRHENRALYLNRWSQFDVKGESPIEFADIPWPVDDIIHLTRKNIEEFLLSGIESDSEIKSTLRREQIRFHPDRWHRFDKRIPTDKQRKKIMNTVTEISRMVNVLIEERT